jgi:hypothetical protein
MNAALEPNKGIRLYGGFRWRPDRVPRWTPLRPEYQERRADLRRLVRIAHVLLVFLDLLSR